ncbi:right-handed parallel beta-helix repeat-containing protein [Burkholderia seminalis]|uniref:right-handed parallel beta-helix repeat-containing protein n=1 Tax=Burkholderia seminalis TaxID=488731 RepID=UPI00158EA6CF|nr:right-handed parallel beta-helix repeat-containing protein [Burkholderia seminalis]
MTVSSSTSRADYNGNGVTTLFTVPFYFLDPTHIKVIRTDFSTTPPTTATLGLNSDFTTTGAGSPGGGSIQTTVAPTATQRITILRNVPFLQLIHYVPNDPFPAATHEQALDLLTMEVQELAEELNHTIQFPTYEPLPPTLLPASQRAGQMLGFDSTGSLTYLPVPASVGAGDLRVDTFIANGSGQFSFIPGTTTTLNLSRAPGNLANTLVFFDAAYQGPDGVQGLNGAALAFTAAIPVGVQRVYVISGTTISLNAPAPGSVGDASLTTGTKVYNRAFYSVDPRDFGAIGNGIADDTAAINAAVATVTALGGGDVRFSRGTYLVTSPIVVTADNVTFDGAGKYAVTVTVPNNAAGFTGYNPNAIFILNGSNNGLRNIGIDGNIANNSSQAFGAVAQTVAKNGFYVEDCYIRNCIYNGIVLNPITGSSTGFAIRRNRIENIGWQAIATYCSGSGEISGNSISSCGSNGIVTGYNASTGNFTVSQYIRINNNQVSKAAPPTHIVGSAAENGFLIVFGAGDQYIAVENNICWDNRNAGEDGIGLGQDGTRYNQGCTVTGNVVGYAGLFGIDATNQSVVQNNIILFSTQCGIKVGTDLGGNCTNCLIDGNLIIQPNNPTTHYPTVQNMGIQVYSGAPPGIYSGIKIRNNTVLDSRTGSAQLTQYGLEIVFESGLSMADNEFTGNDFSQVAVAGVFAAGTGAANPSGWRWKNNTYPQQVVPVSGATPTVFGCENVTLSQTGATTVTNLIGGYEGMTLDVQLNDSNTTWKFNSNPNMYGNTNTNLTTVGGNWMQFKYFNNVWAGGRIVN